MLKFVYVIILLHCGHVRVRLTTGRRRLAREHSTHTCFFRSAVLLLNELVYVICFPHDGQVRVQHVSHDRFEHGIHSCWRFSARFLVMVVEYLIVPPHLGHVLVSPVSLHSIFSQSIFMSVIVPFCASPLLCEKFFPRSVKFFSSHRFIVYKSITSRHKTSRQ